MAILSDHEIQKRMARGELVLGGDVSRAQECSYSFVSGKAFVPGDAAAPTEFDSMPGAADIVVSPGEMIWIRTKESVVIPKELVGFWWQTNTLSRKGLMLVNMSMVEPGYAGNLACLFVNFAKSSVIIDAKTPIAKMVFTELRGEVLSPYAGAASREQYDAALRQLAIDQPKTFLKVAELSTDLERARQTAVSQIERSGDETQTSVQAALAAAKADAVENFKKDIPAAIRSSFWLALAAFGILTLLSFGVEYLKGELWPDVNKIARSEADEAIKERITLSGNANSNEVNEILNQLKAIDSRLGALEKKP